jgi:hypothetical protein
MNDDGPISISTIGDFIDAGYSYTVFCDDCDRHNNLNLEALAERLGREHSALAGDLSRRMRCKGCGSKRMRFLVQTHAGWNGTGSHGDRS